MNKVISWFAENHVAANLLMFFFVLGGILTINTIKIEFFPETSLDKVSISVVYPGASPAEIEESVVTRIEENIAGLTGIRRIDSQAFEGMGTITVEALQGWDIQKLTDDVKAEVDRITTLPEEAEKPTVRQIIQKAQVLWVAVYGDAPEATLKSLAETLQDELTDLPGVTQVELFGVRKGEIQIEISESTLRRHDLTLGKVGQAIRRASLDLPAGSIKTRGSEIMLRAKGRRYHAKDYADIPILTKPDGSLLTLGSIATLVDGFEDSNLMARFQRKPACLIEVFRVADQSALDVAQKVKDYVEVRKASMPHGTGLDIFGDRSIMLKSRLNLLLKNMAMGLVLVACVLWIFLEVRLAFWVTLGIPISFLIAICFLPQIEISVNMISLFAFILVLGIVVDDAIVVGENVFKKREQGMPHLKAAIQGTLEVGPPVIFSVLTTVAAFAPLMMGTGTMGKVMRNIPAVVILVLLGSLMESLFILPAHLARSNSRNKVGKTKEKITSRILQKFIQGPYKRFLKFCLAWRYAVVALGLGFLLLALGVMAGGWVKFTLFPKVESDMLMAHLAMAPGTSQERTTEVVTHLGKSAVKAMAEVDAEMPPGTEPVLKHTASLVGLSINPGHGGGFETGSHLATVFAQLIEGEKRKAPAQMLNTRWREASGKIAGAETLTFQSELFNAGNPVEVHLSAPRQEEVLAATAWLKEQLAVFKGVFDITDSFVAGKDELQMDLKPRGRTLGLTLEDISQQVRHAFYGAEALRLQRNKDEVKVMVLYPLSQRRSLANIEDMRIRTPQGDEVPFRQVAEVKITKGYNSIIRSQRRKVIIVSADVDETITNANEVRQKLEADILPKMKERFPNTRYDMEGEGREQKESMEDVIQGFILALFLIYVLLAVPFKSFSQPLIVMAAIPFGIVGALAGHLLMGMNMSLLSLFGIVGLSGVVVNDSLLMVHSANRMRDQGASPWQAIMQAGPLRFRPILLTSVTTFAGLTPIILEKSMQAQFLIPMAVSLGFGVLFATGITLLLIPCGYLIQDDMVRGLKALRGIFSLRSTSK